MDVTWNLLPFIVTCRYTKKKRIGNVSETVTNNKSIAKECLFENSICLENSCMHTGLTTDIFFTQS